MNRGATSIEKAFAAVAVLAIAGLVAVATALAGPAETPSTEASAPVVTDTPFSASTEAVTLASRRSVTRSALAGRRYSPGQPCGKRDVCGRAAAWIPAS